MKNAARNPPLFRLLAINCLAGIVTSWLFLAGIIWLDVGGLHQLLSRSSEAGVAIAVLAAGFAVTFGSAAMGTAVWLMPYGDGDGETGKRARPPVAPGTEPVPVRAVRVPPKPRPR